jgi:hypothetical protein
MRAFVLAVAGWWGTGLASAGDIQSIYASPGSIGFVAPDPDTPPAPVPATLTWKTHGGGPDYSVTVQAGASHFENCPGVPVSAVRVACVSIDQPGEGACAPPFPLSASPRLLATGPQKPGNRTFTISLTFTFADRWRYVAALSPLCSLSLTYVVNAP